MNSLKKIFQIVLLVSGILQYSQTICSNNPETIAFYADTASDRFMNIQTTNLSPFINISNISGGTYVNSYNQTYCSIRMGDATLFRKTGVGTSYNASVFYSYTVTTTANSPILYPTKFSASIAAYDGILNNPAIAVDRLAYYLRIAILDNSTNIETTLINSTLINNYGVDSTPSGYRMQPGRTYTIKYYAWRTSASCTDLYLDNPKLFLSPIPNSTPNACISNLSGTVGSALTLNIISSTPTGLSLRWLQGTTDVTENAISNGTYTPYYYNSSSNCYMPAGNDVTVGNSPTFTTNQVAGTQSVCQNVTPTTLSVVATGVTYQWYSNTTNTNSGGIAISGATSSTYTPPASNTSGTTYYYAVITNSYGCSTASNVRGVTVTPLPVITAQPNTTPQNVCVDGTFTALSVTATNATSYQWYYSTAASGGILITVSGATSSTYTPPTAYPFSTRYYYVTVSNSCGSVTSSPRVPMTVTSPPSFLEMMPPSQTVTQNSTPLDILITSGNGPHTSYQWYSNTSNTNTGGTLIPGANSETYTPPTNTVGTMYYYVVVGNSIGCTATSPTALVNVENCTPANPISVNLNTEFEIGTAPSGSVAEWHTSSTPSASTLIGDGMVMATSTPTNYWIFYSNTASNCYSPGTKIVVVTNTCCNYTRVDLTSLPQITPPAGSVVEWYQTNNRQGLVSDPSAVPGGIYFPFFYDSLNNCYSPAGTPVLVAINSDCCTDTAPPVNTFVIAQCPSGTANLNTQSHTGTVPSGYVLQWFTDAAHTTPVADPTTVGAGTYYAFYYNSSTGCYSPASEAVSVVVFVCSPCTASDPQSVDLTTRFPVDAPSPGYTVQWHTSASPSPATLLSNTTIQSTSTPNNYWVYYYNGSGYSLVSQVVVVTNSCCNYPTLDLNSINTSTAPLGSTKVWFTTPTHDSGTEVVDPAFAAMDSPYWAFFYDSSTDTYTSAGAPVLLTIDRVCSSACYKPGVETGGDVLDTKVGISSLGRAGAEQGDNWPMVRKGGHIALESKTKAFVPNRVAFSDADNDPLTPDVPVGISAANFVEGMMVYDTTNQCLKIYTLREGDTEMAWHCFTTPACPD